MKCPCGTGKEYGACCKPFHQGGLPRSALELMRSRYSAYALNLPEYIIATTHPENPQDNDLKKIAEFCTHTTFKKLEIIDFQEKGDVATVTFVAHLAQDGKDFSLSERSTFEKVDGKWLYLNGES